MAYIWIAPVAIILIVLGGIKKNKWMLMVGGLFAVVFAFLTYTSTPPETYDDFQTVEALSEKPEVTQLSEYLQERHPDASYQIKVQETNDQTNSYITVYFEDEPGWYYNYLVTDGGIEQTGLLAPEGEDPKEGKYYEELEKE